MTTGQLPNEWWMRAPTAGHSASTALMREAPTTQEAYSHPLESTSNTDWADALT